MRYPKLKETDYKAFNFGDFKKGLHTKGSSQTGIEDCKNLFWSDGYLVNRPAISTDISKVFHINNLLMNTKASFTTAEVYHNSQCKKIAYLVESDDSTHAAYKFMLIAPDGQITPCGQVELDGISRDEFNFSHSVWVLSGKKSKGSGVYAFFRVYTGNANDENYKYDLRIYELDESCSAWRKIEESEKYVPYYYKDGRGTDYEESGQKLPEPSVVEPLNLLGDSYYCTYTPDGTSRYFQLPFTDCEYTTEDIIKIELTVPGNQVLTWIVTDDELGYADNEVEYGDKTISVQMVKYNRRVRFVNYIPPKSKGLSNNIKITVTKKKPENYRKISSMCEGGRFSVGDMGNCCCLYSSETFPNEMLIGASENPLYFPENQHFSIGLPTQRITALSSQGEKLVVFKEKEIYYISSNYGKTAVALLDKNIGCNLPKTLSLCNDRLVWVNNNKNVYVLSGFNQTAGGNIYCISQRISEKVQKCNIEDARGCSFKDKYVFFFENNAFVLDYSRATLSNRKDAIENAAWFYWCFPTKTVVEDCLCYHDDIICLVSSDDRKLYYGAVMDKQSAEDKALYFKEGFGVEEKAFNMESMIKTDIFTNGTPYLKHFLEVWFNIVGEQNPKLDFIDDVGATLKSINIDIKRGNSMAPYRIMTFIKSKGIGFVFKIKGRAAIGGISCKYRELDR